MALILLTSSHPAHAQYVDTNASCLLCHQTALPRNDFCELVPAQTWAASDKHNRAFALLHERDPADPAKGEAKRELVRRILGFELREAFTDDRYLRLSDAADAETVRKVAAVKACLRCHATWPVEADERHPHAPPVPLALGVSCQACHGPGERWETPHRLSAWRLVTPEAKAALDFADVRSTVAKARLCASCHIGDLAQGKFVRHEWYAGGHPPLPGFELASFTAQMPVHWKPLRDKGAFAFRDERPPDDAGLIAAQIDALVRAGIPAEAIKDSYREANFPTAAADGFDPMSDLPRTRDAMLGGIAVLEAYTRLVGEYAEQAAEGHAPWPELALYDCTACHQELRSRVGSGERPRRTHPLGRPPLARWPLALAPLAAQQAAGYEPAAAEQRWSQVANDYALLQRATTQRLFGDPAAMSAAAEALAASLERLAADAAAKRFDEHAARGALRWLTDSSREDAADFYSARQAAWAMRELFKDLRYDEAPGAYFDPARIAAAPLREAQALFRRNDHDALALELPSGPERSVVEYLHHWLPAATSYDPAWFRQEADALRQRLESGSRR